MIDFLINFYPWIKAGHIIAVISWMAGIFYLPRLFVHHVESVSSESDAHKLFQYMELKLLKVIMNPAMMATWIFGICLVITPGIIDWSSIWPWIKLICVISMTVFHVWLGKQRRLIANEAQTLSGRGYRLANEIPTVLMIIIVISVITKFA